MLALPQATFAEGKSPQPACLQYHHHTLSLESKQDPSFPCPQRSENFWRGSITSPAPPTQNQPTTPEAQGGFSAPHLNGKVNITKGQERFIDNKVARLEYGGLIFNVKTLPAWLQEEIFKEKEDREASGLVLGATFYLICLQEQVRVWQNEGAIR